MNLKESQILETALTKLFPFALLFSGYVFSYGGAFPGGGFQAGVIIGTFIVILELVFERKIYSNPVFERIELTGILFLGIALIAGFMISGYPFGGLYSYGGSSYPLANAMIWFLNMAIFLEVSGSMVLIFRNFLFWESDDTVRIASPHLQQAVMPQESTVLRIPQTKRKKEFLCVAVIAALLIAVSVIVILLFMPAYTPTVHHGEMDVIRMTASEYSIRNMVSVVYLGPRVIDTFLEVMVVILTVLGIKVVRGSR